ncbi:MAG: T9SS type A sorting domain-containing protein, partial [Ignavibacteria bacterium]|nr:T9SS type A sorting domain-containing protein [Ignavibacteria bacterium]
IDQNYNVFITGISDRGSFNYDYATIKYSQTVGILPISETAPLQYSLSQNYPNPFNPTTKVRYDIFGNNTSTRIVIYDITGRELIELINEKQNKGTYEITFDATEFASGIYFYKLITEDFTDTKKMVLIK